MNAGAPGHPPAARVHTVEVSRDDARTAWSLAARCVDVYGDCDSRQFARDAAVIAGELPRAVRAAFNDARLDHRAHALLLTGNIVDDEALGNTPGHWRDAANAASAVHAFHIALYASLLGDLIGWRTQQAGRLVTDVLPIRGWENSMVSSSSALELGWHTEDAFSPCRADHVGLFCLRNPDSVATTIGYIETSDLPDDIVDLLFEARFIVRPDASHTASGGNHADEMPERDSALPPPPLVSILSGARQAPTLRIDSDYTDVRPGDRAAELALATLRKAIDANLYDLVLAPGDVCFLNNDQVVHGRRPFRASFDGRDRWLKRVNVTRDLRRSVGARSGPADRTLSDVV